MEKYSVEWWEELAAVADGIMRKAELVRDESERMSYRLRHGGWEDGEPDSQFSKDFGRLIELARTICEEEK